MEEVVVIGAGPSGLMMASELARYGVPCRILDKAKGPTKLSKALALQARTLEIFDFLGIADPFVKEGIHLKAVNPISRNKPLARILFEPDTAPITLPQSRTEQLLGAHLSSLGVQIEWGVELLSFKQEQDAIELKLSSGEVIQTQWLIGCDGAHSTVRGGLDLKFKGEPFPDIFSLADVEIEWEYPHDELVVFLEPTGVVAAFPMPGDQRYRLIYEHLSGEANEPTLEEVQLVLSRCVGGEVQVTHPRWMGNFHISSRLTNHYKRGPIFLVGDAAHIHSPVGGQGMNTGLQDAFNLAWKLAFVIQGREGKELLETYESERQRVGERLLKATEIATSVATLKNRLALILRGWVAPWLLNRKWVQKKLTRAISQLDIKYGKKGIRAPNTVVYLNGEKTDLFSLWKGARDYKKLVFGLKSPKDPCFWIGTGKEMPPAPGVTLLEDRTGEARRAYRAKEGSVFIIRPDGYLL